MIDAFTIFPMCLVHKQNKKKVEMKWESHQASMSTHATTPTTLEHKLGVVVVVVVVVVWPLPFWWEIWARE